jgi:hypothetical protein
MPEDIMAQRDQDTLSRLQQGILAALSSRSIKATLCPSEVARRMDPQHWRALMPLVREAARSLAREGRVVVSQRGVALSPESIWRGPVRIGKPGERR